MQAWQPLGVEHIGLGPCPATGGLPGLDEADLEALSFQQLEKWDPVDPGGLDGNGGDATALEPVSDLKQVAGVVPKVRTLGESRSAGTQTTWLSA